MYCFVYMLTFLSCHMSDRADSVFGHVFVLCELFFFISIDAHFIFLFFHCLSLTTFLPFTYCFPLEFIQFFDCFPLLGVQPTYVPSLNTNNCRRDFMCRHFSQIPALILNLFHVENFLQTFISMLPFIAYVDFFH